MALALAGSYHHDDHDDHDGHDHDDDHDQRYDYQHDDLEWDNPECVFVMVLALAGLQL